MCRFCIGEFSPLMIWFAVNAIWCAVGPRPWSRAPPFVCLGLPIRCATLLRNSRRICQEDSERKEQLLTRAPNPVPASSPTQTFPLPSTRNLRASSPMAVLLVPDMMPSKVTSPNASFSLLVLFTLSFAVRQVPPGLIAA